jgi:hypothetical protein
MNPRRQNPPAPRGAVRKEYAVFDFASTHDTIAAERLATARGYVAEVIPQPPGRTGRCGVALRVSATEAEELAEIFAGGGLTDFELLEG